MTPRSKQLPNRQLCSTHIEQHLSPLRTSYYVACTLYVCKSIHTTTHVSTAHFILYIRLIMRMCTGRSLSYNCRSGVNIDPINIHRVRHGPYYGRGTIFFSRYCTPPSFVLLSSSICKSRHVLFAQWARSLALC